MADNALMCRCSRSLAAICGAFAALGVGAFLATDRCLDSGGRVSDASWVCGLASGAESSLWSLVSPVDAGIAILLVGVPVYLAVNALGRRLTASPGR